jgi:hypothetical protein
VLGRLAPLRTPRPCDLVHIDVTKLGRVPDGGGWRLHGRSEQVRGRAIHGRGMGYDFLHVAVDDHSRMAYLEALPDECDPIAAIECVRHPVAACHTVQRQRRRGGPITAWRSVECAPSASTTRS